MLKKKAVLAFLTMAIWGLACQLSEPKRNAEQYFQRKPVMTAGYQIRDRDRFIGYMHKYEWETMRGGKPHYYIVYDQKGNLIGRISKNGETAIYNKAGEPKVLGHYILKRALENIYGSSAPLQVVRADRDANYRTWAQAKNSPQNVEKFWERQDIDWSKVEEESTASMHKRDIPQSTTPPSDKNDDKTSASNDSRDSDDDDGSSDGSFSNNTSDDDVSNGESDDNDSSEKESWPDEEESWSDK